MTTRRAFSVAIFCRHQGEVLLVRHRRLDTWLPVGGEIEPGETPREAAVRELREETGRVGRFPPGLGVDGTPPGHTCWRAARIPQPCWHLAAGED